MNLDLRNLKTVSIEFNFRITNFKSLNLFGILCFKHLKLNETQLSKKFNFQKIKAL